MDRSKINQSELSYSSGAGFAKINLSTGRLLYEYYDVGIGNNLFNIDVSHIYNSMFDLSQYVNTYVGNNFKLNVQQYIIVENGKYVYIDSMGYKHIFEQLSNNKFYDSEGLELILEVNNNLLTIKDQQNNRLIFENNKIIKSVSNINETKKFDYDSFGRLKIIYDTNYPNMKLLFEYDNKTNLLNYIKYKNGINVVKKIHYEYNENNNLIKVSDDIEKHMFIYAKNYLTNVVSLKDKSTFLFDYNINGQIESIKQGFVTLESVKKEKNNYYLNDNSYVDEDKYIGGKYISDENFIIKNPTIYGEDLISYNNLIYDDNNTIVENEKNLKFIYFFNEKGYTVSEFEINNGDINDLKTTEKYGKETMISKSNSLEKINTRNVHILNMDYIISKENLMKDYFENLKSYRKYKCSNYINFMCDFWLNIQQNVSNSKVNIEINSSENAQTQEEIFSFNVDTSAINSWQHVAIPICIKYQNLNDIKIMFGENNSNKIVKIADMKLYHSGVSKYCLTNGENRGYVDKITKIKYKITSDSDEITEYVNSNLYFSEKDIQSTYYSLFKTRGLDDSDLPYILSSCDGTKKMLVNSVKFYSNNIEFPVMFGSDEYGNNTRALYFSEVKSPDNNLYTYGIPHFLKNININGKNTDCILQITEINKGLKSDKNNHEMSSIYNYYDINGNLLKEIDEYGVEVCYYYDEKGHLIEKTMKHEDTDEVISTKYSINETESSEESYRGKVVTTTDDHSGNISNIHYNKDEEKSLSVEMKYNTTSQIKKISNNLDGANYLKYDKNGRLLAVTPIGWNKSNMYGFLFKYNLLGETTNYYLMYRDELKKTNKQLLLSRNMNYVENKLTTSYYRDLYNSSEIDTSTVHFDKYGRITSVINGDKEITYRRQELWESNGVSKIEEKYDPYENRTYKYHYNEFNDLTEYEVFDEDGKSYFSTKLNSPNQVQYGGVYYKCENTKDESKLMNPRIKETITEVVNDKLEILPIKTSYEFDKLGRLSYKEDVIKDGLFGANSKVTEEIIYKKGTFQVEQITKKITNPLSKSQTYQINYTYDKKGNISNKKITSERGNDSEETLNVYKYDNANRLIFESSTNSSFIYADKTYSYNKDGSLYCESMAGESIYYTYDKGRLTKRKEKFIENLFDYDNFGNCTHYNIDSKTKPQNMFWERGNLLKQYTCDKNIKYYYNGEGVRFKKTINDNNVDYVYDGSKLIREERNGLMIRYLYDADGLSGIIPLYNNDEFQYTFVKDAEDNVISIYNKDKEVAYYEYDSWGNCMVYDKKGGTIITDEGHIGNINPIRWKSQYYDTESKLYFINGRYYSPLMKQFISAVSPEVAFSNANSLYSLNLYSLTVANPINLVYNTYTYETFEKLIYDSDELTKWQYFWQVTWQKFWNSPLGKAISIGLMVIAVIIIIVVAFFNIGAAAILAKALVKSVVISGLWFFGAAAIAGFCSKKGFGPGFFNYVNNNWSFSLAITGFFVIISTSLNISSAIKIVNASQKSALQYAKDVFATSKRKYNMVSTAIDKKTGKIYYGKAGRNPDFIPNKLLKAREFPSLEDWDDIFNCAEVRAVSDALDDGARLSDLVVTTVRVKDLAMAPMCRNCRKLLRGILLVVSG